MCVPCFAVQAELFETCGMHELVEAALDGYAVTVFAFGQTGGQSVHPCTTYGCLYDACTP